MTSSLLFRAASRSSPSSIGSTVSRLSGLRRGFHSAPARQQAQPVPVLEHESNIKSPFEYHTVEDLQGLTAKEILAESGSAKDAQIRHFTGKFGYIL